MSQALNTVPDTPAEMADVLRRASAQKLSVVITGAGTKMDWGRRPQRIDAILSTRALNRLVAHQHGDLTATIEAGASLRQVNAALAVHRQWLPLDPAFADEATIGGILATNDSGPLRQRYGTPRDLVIGTHVATADGLLAKSGGQVVKNVAGYDLSKLLAGSFGSLAVIVSATFKLSPSPAASKTVVIDGLDAGAAGRIVAAVMASQLEPLAFEIHLPDMVQRVRPAAIAIRFASVAAAVDAQVESVLGMAAVKGCATSVAAADAESALWREHNERVWAGPGAVIRASWRPADIAMVIRDVQSCAETSGVRHGEVLGRAGVGAGWIRLDGEPGAVARAIEHLRGSPLFGNVVLQRGSDDLKALVDVWGSPGDRQTLFGSLKRAFDPQGILNAGRGPL